MSRASSAVAPPLPTGPPPDPLPARKIPVTSEGHLPAPPTDDEVYWYFGPQRRWVPLFTSLSFCFTAFSLFLFSLRIPALWVFIAVLVVNVAGLVMSLFDTQNQRRLTRDSHQVLIRAWHPDVVPSVDVYLPTCGESIAVLRNAYHYVSTVEWTGPLRIWVLDDAGRAEVRELAEEFGFSYRSRPDRGVLRKAGNLNYALGITDGDVIAILDADFCPRPDFLHHLVPYLAVPEVGIVQSPQCFDTDPAMNWIERAAGAAQEWFFRWIQPSRDAHGAAICCGSNAVYRRSAIEAAGGFAKLDHSEDMYTGLSMREHGYRVRYVPLLLAKGLSPDNLPAFINQQYRWALGNLHLLNTPKDQRTTGGWRPSLAYWNGVLSYVLAPLNVFVAPLPPLIMMFCFPADIRPWHALPLVFPLWSWLVLLPAVSRTRWRIEVIRAHQVIGFTSAVALLHTLRGRHAGWVPTGTSAGRSPLARRVGTLALGWLIASTAAGWLGLAYDVAEHGWANYWGLATYLATMSVLALPLIRDLIRAMGHKHPGRTVNAGHTGPSWPEFLAITVALAMFTLIASGGVNAILK